MKNNARKTALLGDLVAAAFDGAEQYSTDPREVSRLATRAVLHMLRSARKTARKTPRARKTPSYGGAHQWTIARLSAMSSSSSS